MPTRNDTVLVHGGAGGVGHMVLQLARLWGIGVATAGPANHDLLRELGATPITYYGEGLLDRARSAAPGGYAAALDLIGTDEAIDTSLALVAADRVGHRSVRTRQRRDHADRWRSGRRPRQLNWSNAARAELAALAGAGKLTVTVDRSYPLAQAGAAHDYLRSGHARGKVILLP